MARAVEAAGPDRPAWGTEARWRPQRQVRRDALYARTDGASIGNQTQTKARVHGAYDTSASGSDRPTASPRTKPAGVSLGGGGGGVGLVGAATRGAAGGGAASGAAAVCTRGRKG